MNVTKFRWNSQLAEGPKNTMQSQRNRHRMISSTHADAYKAKFKSEIEMFEKNEQMKREYNSVRSDRENHINSHPILA